MSTAVHAPGKMIRAVPALRGFEPAEPSAKATRLIVHPFFCHEYHHDVSEQRLAAVGIPAEERGDFLEQQNALMAGIWKGDVDAAASAGAPLALLSCNADGRQMRLEDGLVAYAKRMLGNRFTFIPGNLEKEEIAHILADALPRGVDIRVSGELSRYCLVQNGTLAAVALDAEPQSIFVMRRRSVDSFDETGFGDPESPVERMLAKRVGVSRKLQEEAEKDFDKEFRLYALMAKWDFGRLFENAAAKA